MKTSSEVPFAKVPAPPFEQCAHCREMNVPGRARLWRVKDERGTHLDCDVCSHSEPYPAFQLP